MVLRNFKFIVTIDRRTDYHRLILGKLLFCSAGPRRWPALFTNGCLTFCFLFASFNQLDLPAYETYEKLRFMLLRTVQECPEGFGLV